MCVHARVHAFMCVCVYVCVCYCCFCREMRKNVIFILIPSSQEVFTLLTKGIYAMTFSLLTEKMGTILIIFNIRTDLWQINIIQEVLRDVF